MGKKGQFLKPKGRRALVKPTLKKISERLWRSVKCECVYITEFKGVKDLRRGLKK